jgi:hypothetical protein
VFVHDGEETGQRGSEVLCGQVIISRWDVDRMSYRQVEKMIKNEGYDNIKCLNVVIVI